MRVIILAMLVVELFLPGVYSVAAVAELRGKPQCNNPKGKLGAASFYKCGQAVCEKSGKKGIWNICPANAKQSTVEEIQKSVNQTKTKVTETELTVNKIETRSKETETTVNKIETRSKETELTVNKIETRSKETETKLTEVEKIVKMLLQLALSNAILPVVYYEPEEFAIAKNNLKTTLDYYGPEFIVSFNLMLSTLDSSIYYNIIHLGLGGDYDVFGDRNPAVWLVNKGFVINSAINGNKGFGKHIFPPIQAGKWIKFEISQLLIAGKFIFEVKVDDISYWEETNNDARPFANVQLFAGNQWHPAAAGKIKELKVQTKRQ